MGYHIAYGRAHQRMPTTTALSRRARAFDGRHDTRVVAQ